MEYRYLDCNGVEIRKGDKVRVGPDPGDVGTILSISDPDGDVDEYGRTVGINPSVKVQFPDCDDSFMCAWQATGPWDDDNPDWQCDDVEKVKH